MSLNNLELDENMIARLYTKALIGEMKTVTPKTTQPATTLSASSIRYLGENGNNITIIANDPRHAFLAEDHLTLLIRMLGACKLHIGDVAIVNTAHVQPQFDQIREQLHPRNILFLGIGPSALQMPLKQDLFSIHSFENGTYLCAPSLEELNQNNEESKALKSRLWTSLKQLFDIK